MRYLNQTQLLDAKITLLTWFFAISFLSCKKEEIKAPPIASLTVVNAVTNGNTVILGSNITGVFPYDYDQFGLPVGDKNLYLWPYGDSLHPYFTYSKLNVKQGEAYSLFLGGIPTAVDGILVKENIPYRTDSTAGIRFINLCPNSTPLSITLASSPTVNEVSNLAYKQLTEFRSYAALYNSSYTFEIRNETCPSPNVPLATFSLSASKVPRFANITLVISKDASGVSVFRVKNDR